MAAICKEASYALDIILDIETPNDNNLTQIRTRRFRHQASAHRKERQLFNRAHEALHDKVSVMFGIPAMKSRIDSRSARASGDHRIGVTGRADA